MLRKFKYIIPLAIAVAFISCKKTFFDINVDPNNPSTLPVNNLLPEIERNLGFASAISSGISAALEVYVHRITVREAPNGYGVTGSSGFVDPMWDTYYSSTLTNADIIIAKAVPVGNFKYAGIAKIIKAFAVSQLVDVFGDVPYSEATKLLDKIRNPKFDDDATIYPQLIALLDEGIGDVKNTAINPLSPGIDDVIYGGNITKWVKAANTIKLKLYAQMRLVKNVSAEVTALLANPATLISSTAENFQLPYSSDNKNPGFADYTAAQRTQDMSPWFYEVLKGYNQNIFTDIEDPRIPYYFFNQVKLGQSGVNDNNPTEYRDDSFVSIYFGSNGPDVGRTQQNTMTLLGLYPVGGRFDDGEGGPVNETSATGAAPYKFVTYADRLYLEAELAKQGVITGGDAKAKTLAAITESFKQVDAVVAMTGTPGIPVLAGSAPVTAYIGKVMAEYDAEPTKQLEIIMTQKWIASFGGAIDAYTDYRRTGFPVLFDPSNPAMAPGGKVQPPIHGNPLVDPQNEVPVNLNLPYPLSLPWPSPELTSNLNAPEQKQPSTYKIFWLP
ncbi:MAG: SusD/RagB family nutrient-binding outer membrane lipoprotein [Ferruginibacter sp.]